MHWRLLLALISGNVGNERTHVVQNVHGACGYRATRQPEHAGLRRSSSRFFFFFFTVLEDLWNRGAQFPPGAFRAEVRNLGRKKRRKNQSESGHRSHRRTGKASRWMKIWSSTCGQVLPPRSMSVLAARKLLVRAR